MTIDYSSFINWFHQENHTAALCAIKKENTSSVNSLVEVIENLGHEKILCVKIVKSETFLYLRINSEISFEIGEFIDVFIDINKILFFDPIEENLIEG